LLTAVTFCLGVLGWCLVGRSATSQEATLRVVFVGLAALTLPHVLLAIAFGRSGARIGSRGEQCPEPATGADQNTGRTRRT
jgi:hypothetical protein